nr:hypothetical protein [Nostoc sp. ChiSLP03a]
MSTVTEPVLSVAVGAAVRAASRREVRATPTEHLQQQCSILETKRVKLCKPTNSTPQLMNPGI